MKSINSKLKPSDIEKILQDTAKDLGKQKKNRNDVFGYGLLNTYSAIEKAYKKNK